MPLPTKEYTAKIGEGMVHNFTCGPNGPITTDKEALEVAKMVAEQFGGEVLELFSHEKNRPVFTKKVLDL